MKLRATLTAALVILATGLSPAVGADRFWDVNGDTPDGSNDGLGTGTWGVDNFWTLDASGSTATEAWVADDTAVFSAGSGVTGTYDVTVSGTQSASGVRFEEGVVTITGGTELTLTGAATVDIPSSSAEGRINSVIGGSAGLNSTGLGVLILGGANTYTGNTTLALGNTLRLGAPDVIPDGSVLILPNGSPNGAKVQLNGNNETVKSIGGGGGSTNAFIDIGSATLTLNDDGETRTYTGLFTSSAGGKVEKTGDGTLTLNGSTAAFVEGEFILSKGTLGIENNNAFGTNGNNSTFTINNDTKISATAARTMSTKNLNISGSFTFDLAGATGNVEWLGGSGAAFGTTVITLKASPTITVTNSTGGTGVLILRGAIGDEGAGRGFTKKGAGVLTLTNNANTFSGDVTIEEGILRVTHQTATNTTGVNPAYLAPTTTAIGNGAGTVRLSGGTLNYNGAVQIATDPRTMPVLNPIVVTANSTISYTATGNHGTSDVTFVFSNNSITGTDGTLTFSRDASNAATLNTFKPTFSGSGFNFGRPVVISNDATDSQATPRKTELTSTNTMGTQTWSGDISGTGGYKRAGAGGSTIFTGANTFSGGTTVEAGTLSASGASATFGSGNVTVTGGTLEIATGVANAIADAAMLSISGTGLVNLGTGINEVLAALSLGGVMQGSGTYGSSSSSATFQLDQWFTGLGILTVPLPGDYNGDGKVDAADYVVWRKFLNTNNTLSGNGDESGGSAGVVNQADYDYWRAHFGNPTPGSGSVLAVAAPEPATVWLLAIFIGSAFVGCRRLRTA